MALKEHHSTNGAGVHLKRLKSDDPLFQQRLAKEIRDKRYVDYILAGLDPEQAAQEADGLARIILETPENT